MDKTIEIFHGMKLAKDTTVASLYEIAEKQGLTKDQIQSRVEQEGRKDIFNLPEETIQSWIAKLDNPF